MRQVTFSFPETDESYCINRYGQRKEAPSQNTHKEQQINWIPWLATGICPKLSWSFLINRSLLPPRLRFSAHGRHCWQNRPTQGVSNRDSPGVSPASDRSHGHVLPGRPSGKTQLLWGSDSLSCTRVEKPHLVNEGEDTIQGTPALNGTDNNLHTQEQLSPCPALCSCFNISQSDWLS